MGYCLSLFYLLTVKLPIALHNHLRRTLRRALAAVGALLIVDDCHVVIHVDGVELTLFDTQRTADAAGLAFGLDIFALVVGAALYQMLGAVWYQLNQAVWTGGHAFAAGLSLIHI